ncbi:SNF2 family N-terminal domain-containing protein, partial [Astrocystis sublimbata]
MAPRTRRSTGAAKDTSTAATLEDEIQAVEQQRREALVEAQVNAPKRGRGRPPKNRPVHPAAGGSDSTSSAPTPLTNTSDGEYSTPATSNAVTPAPPAKGTTSVPVSAPVSSSRPRRGRLTIELPDETLDDDGDDEVPLRRSVRTRPQRQRLSAPALDEENDVDEYIGLYGEDDNSMSAAVARQLQREEDQKASARSFSIPILQTSANQGPTAGDPKVLPRNDNLRPRGNVKRTRSTRYTLRADPSGSDSVYPNHHSQPRKRQKLSTSATTANVDDVVDDGMISIEEPGVRSDDDSINSVLDFSDLESDGDSSANDSIIGNAYSSMPRNAGDPDSDTDPGHDSDDDTAVDRPTYHRYRSTMRRVSRRTQNDRIRLESNHPEIRTMWEDLANMPDLNAGTAVQPASISLQLKPFQLQGLAWMKAMEQTPWRGGLLGDEMGLGKTIQAVSLIMSDYPAKMPTLVLLPPVALGQWQDEIATYTGNKLKTIVFHGTNAKAKNMPVKELRKFDVIIMSYNSLESLYRKQEKGMKRKDGLYKEKSVLHQ